MLGMVHLFVLPAVVVSAYQWRIQDFEKGGSVPIPRGHAAEGSCIEVRSAGAEKVFRLHFSLIRMGSRGTFMLCTASSRCS